MTTSLLLRLFGFRASDLLRVSGFAFRIFCLLAATLVAFWGPSARADSAQIYLDSLVDFQRYGDSIWHTASYLNAPTDAGYFGDGASKGNGGIRGNCGTAIAYAVLVRAFPSDPARAARLDKIRQALNYAANTHVSGTNICNDNLQWGHDWQTALWAGSMGFACLLVQSDLPASTVQAVQRAVADEATYRAGVPPASGYVSDTKAEENGWNSNIPSLAAAWLTNHPNASLWLTSAKQYLANSYTVADTSGDPLSSWVTTVTLYPSYALENHGFYHPTYEMVAGMSMGDSLLMAQMASPQVATQLQAFAEHNVMNVWTRNLNSMVLDSGEFGYPAGLDWELHDFEQNSYIAWLASHFNDPLARWADARLAQLVRYRQLINGDGRYVGPSGGGFYREAVSARRTAIAWLHWMNAAYPSGPVTAPAPTLVHFPDVEVIAHRTTNGCFTLSYGSRVMAMVEAPALSVPTNAFVATPRQPGMIGLGLLGNPSSAQLVSFATNAAGFTAELHVVNGANGSTEVYINSTGESVGIVEVPWPAVALSGAASSFDVGIENDPLTGGSRLVEWTGGSMTVTNRSGASANVTNGWVCVAGRCGMAAGPAGYFNYAAASSYNRSGAAEDTLQFMPQDSLGARYAVWFPGRNAAQTAARAGLISWTTNSGTVVLTFPGAGGATAQITAPLPVPAPYPPYTAPVASVAASSAQSNYPAMNAFDGILTDYWVSAYGPTNHAEWLRVNFSRSVALSEFLVYPRTDNGGYGPKDIQVFLNVTNAVPASGIPTSGTNVYQGTMAPTATLAVDLARPVTATNALLVITSAYDRGVSTNPRNVQVVEWVLLERAQPGTFGDWVLHQFSEAQLADPSVSGAQADPDHDGVANLVEFAMVGNPLAADPSLAKLQPAGTLGGNLALRYRERKNLGDVQRWFERSTDLIAWSQVTPAAINNVADFGDAWLREAQFPLQSGPAFFRLRFSQ